MTPLSTGFPIKILSFLTFIVLRSGLAHGLAWSCSETVDGFELDLDLISGTWYEAARIPPSEVPACVSVEVPSAIHNDTFKLRLDYVNNVNKKSVPTTEDLTFPWDEATQNGIFQLHYGSGTTSITFTFKLMATDYNNVAAICYYTNTAPSVSMIKIMTRKQLINATLQDGVQKLADRYGYGDQITWVEQSSRCDGAKMTVPTFFATLVIVFTLLLQVFFNKL